MGIALITSTTAGSGADTITTLAMNTTGATLLVAVVSDGGASPATVTDSKGNTWSPLTNYAGAVTQCRISYCVPTSVGTGHTVTATGASGSFPAMCVAAWSGTKATSPLDGSTGATHANGTGTSLACGNISPAEDGELFIAGFAGDAAAASAINLGYTIAETVPLGASWAANLAYLIQTTAAARNPTWTLADQDAQAAHASFKAAPTSNGNFFLFF